jgi:hypothetical protein
VRYIITRGEGGFVVGQSVHTWEHDGLTYKLQSVTETTGLAALFKPARVVQAQPRRGRAEGLRPLEFRHERAGGLDTAASTGRAASSPMPGARTAWSAGAQDMLSMYYQLVLLAPKRRCGGDAHRHRAQTGDATASRCSAKKSWPCRGRAPGARTWTRSGNDTIELWLGRRTNCAACR